MPSPWTPRARSSRAVRLATGWGADAVVRTVLEAVRLLGVEVGHTGPIDSVGIGIPGQVEPGTARVVHAVNLGGRGARPGRRRRAPARRAGPRGERRERGGVRRVRAAHGRRGSLAIDAYLNLGTGIAAGIVADGELWRGARGTAGEVGHISIDPNGPLCRCGQHGCIEALAGGGAIAERWGRPGALPVRDVFDAADRGDPFARDLRAGLARVSRRPSACSC